MTSKEKNMVQEQIILLKNLKPQQIMLLVAVANCFEQVNEIEKELSSN